jgi:hypothetical protein
MAPLRWLGRLVAWLWDLARGGWMGGDLGLRIGSGSAALYTFLFLVLFLVGLVLVLLGFDLNAVDAWIDAQGGWLDAVGTFLFRLACGIVLLICAVAVLGAIFDRKNPEKPGLGCALLALIAGYFAWFGVIGG